MGLGLPRATGVLSLGFEVFIGRLKFGVAPTGI